MIEDFVGREMIEDFVGREIMEDFESESPKPERELLLSELEVSGTKVMFGSGMMSVLESLLIVEIEKLGDGILAFL